jgi:transcription antitermination factor NusG
MELAEIQVKGVRSFQGKWYMVAVRPQREKRLDEQFHIDGLKHFLPIEPVIKNYPIKGKPGHTEKKIVQRIPWPKWTFVCGDPASTWWAIADSYSRAGLGEHNPARYIRPIKDNQDLLKGLEIYERAMANPPKAFCEEDIRAGISRVKIKSGPFAGFEGPVSQVKPFEVFVIIPFMEAMREIKIDRNKVEIV